MSTLKDIAHELESAKSILLFPHINVDGDGLGSCVALAHTARKQGKEAYILMEDDIAENLAFLDKGYTTKKKEILKNPDVTMCVDCSSENRLPKRWSKFLEGKTKLILDHHKTKGEDIGISYVDSEVSSAGELVFELLKEMNVEMDKETGEAIYAAIVTDTGAFKYSNCSRRTHEIVAELYKTGMDHVAVCNEIFESVSPKRITLESKVLDSMEYVEEGKGALACVTKELLNETKTKLADAEGLVATMRGVKGVEVACLLKETDDGIKASLRSKSYADVARIAEEFGGGGHVKAAGCTLKMSVEEAKDIMRKRIEEAL